MIDVDHRFAQFAHEHVEVATIGDAQNFLLFVAKEGQGIAKEYLCQI